MTPKEQAILDMLGTDDIEKKAARLVSLLAEAVDAQTLLRTHYDIGMTALGIALDGLTGELETDVALGRVMALLQEHDPGDVAVDLV